MLNIIKGRTFLTSFSEFICDNKAEDCEALANKGGCLSQHKYMTENCKLTCAMCTPGI